MKIFSVRFFVLILGSGLSYTAFSYTAFSYTAFADPEGMVHMPRIQSVKTYSVPSTEKGEDLQENRGFGEKESETKMMNLMMVEGSGYEGMDMGQMKAGEMKAGEMKAGGMKVAASNPAAGEGSAVQIELTKSPDPAAVGPNLYEFTIKDPKTGKPLVGLKPTAEVSMTSMDMGTDTPRVKERKPGHYQVKAVFSMKGPWSLKILTSKGQKIFPITAGNSVH